MNDSSTVLPFALKDRWTVTVESERVFVKVRHRTRWYAVARRLGHEERRHWCVSRSDALGIAEYMRDGFKRMAEYEYFKALYDAAPEWKRAEIDAYLATLQVKE